MKCFWTLSGIDAHFSWVIYPRKKERVQKEEMCHAGRDVTGTMQRKSIPQKEITLPSKFSTLGLCLACNCIHDSILGIHADRGVILRVNYGSLAAKALHLNGFVGRQGRVLQDIGVETLREVRAGLCKSEVPRAREGKKGERREVKWGKHHQERSVHVCSWHLTTRASHQRRADNLSTKPQ